MKAWIILCLMGGLVLFGAGCARTEMMSKKTPSLFGEGKEWKGVHFLTPGKTGFEDLKRTIADVLAPMGVNVVILEIDYGYEFESHPELCWDDPLSRADVKELLALCREHDIALIPQFQSLGHQSWAEKTHPLLTEYPQFDETPNIPLDNPDIYCRSWCPLHPDVNDVVFALIDELIDAFEAPAFHVGMDEVFLIGEDQCPRCRGKDPAALFARAVNDLHGHIAGERGLRMMMWGDRLLDAEAMGYSKWEAAGDDLTTTPTKKNTAAAVEMIPRDIVICDWHYGKRETYPSVDFFAEKGFDVWPSTWRNPEATRAFVEYAESVSAKLAAGENKGDATGRVLGILCTTWYSGDILKALLGRADELPAPRREQVENVAESIRLVME